MLGVDMSRLTDAAIHAYNNHIAVMFIGHEDPQGYQDSPVLRQGHLCQGNLEEHLILLSILGGSALAGVD